MERAADQVLDAGQAVRWMLIEINDPDEACRAEARARLAGFRTARGSPLYKLELWCRELEQKRNIAS
jgi:hypothetical protein